MRDILRRIHLAIGAILCVPLVVLGLSGSVLVFEDELRAALEPTPHAFTAGEARPLAQIVESARAAAPQEWVPSLVLPAARYGDSVEVRFSDPKRGPSPGGRLVFVDPVSGVVLGTREGTQGILRQIASLHSNLLMRDLGGRSVIGWLGVAMVMLGLTGPLLWWPRRRQWRAAFRIRRDAGAYALLRDLHGVVGICGVGVLLVVSVTGVYLAFPQSVGAAISTLLPVRDLRPNAGAFRVTPQPGRAPLAIDAAVALARAAVPDAGVRSVFLPLRPEQPYRVILTHARTRAGAPPVTAFVDPWLGRVIERRDPAEYSVGERIVAWQRALHAGAGLGWPWRGLVFLSGFLPPLFAASGVTMWLLKRRARNRGGAPQERRLGLDNRGKSMRRQQP